MVVCKQVRWAKAAEDPFSCMAGRCNILCIILWATCLIAGRGFRSWSPAPYSYYLWESCYYNTYSSGGNYKLNSRLRLLFQMFSSYY